MSSAIDIPAPVAQRKLSRFKPDIYSGSLKPVTSKISNVSAPEAQQQSDAATTSLATRGGEDALVRRSSVISIIKSHVEVPTKAEAKHTLSALSLFALLFSNCIGSGYGFEDAMGAGGPLVTATFCLIVPWLWTLQTGLAASELASAIPSNASVLMWINVAFTPTFSFTCVLGTMFIILIGNASYPSLCAQYVGNIVTLNRYTSVLVELLVVALCAGLNISGVEIVGSVSIVMSVITLSPFVAFSFKQLVIDHHWDWEAITYFKKDIDWATFLSIVSWNFGNVENAGSVVEEVADPKVTLPRAIVPMLFASYFAYLIPVVAGASHFGAHQDWSLWTGGYWADVAQSIAGDWLKWYLLAGAIVTSIGYTLTSICCTSRVIAGIGSMRVLPERVSQFLGAYHPRLGTPVNAIVLNAVVQFIMSASLSFNDVVSLSQVIYCTRLVYIYTSVILLRVQHPNLDRPYSIPFGTVGTVIFLAPAIMLSTGVAIMSAQMSTPILGASIGFMVGSVIVSALYVHFYRPDGFEGAIVEEEEFEVEVGEEEYAAEEDDAEPQGRENEGLLEAEGLNSRGSGGNNNTKEDDAHDGADVVGTRPQISNGSRPSERERLIPSKEHVAEGGAVSDQGGLRRRA